jgi:hypothetical protein
MHYLKFCIRAKIKILQIKSSRLKFCHAYIQLLQVTMRFHVSTFPRSGSLVSEKRSTRVVVGWKPCSVMLNELDFSQQEFFFGHPTFLLLPMGGLHCDQLLGVALLILFNAAQTKIGFKNIYAGIKIVKLFLIFVYS